MKARLASLLVPLATIAFGIQASHSARRPPARHGAAPTRLRDDDLTRPTPKKRAPRTSGQADDA